MTTGTAAKHVRTADQLELELEHFSGSERFFEYHMGSISITFTEGVRHLVEASEHVLYDAQHTCGGAWWLLDAIVSWQPKVQAKAPDRGEFQIWTLKVDDLGDQRHARLCCYPDLPGDATARQLIPFTDFPLEEIKLYLENGVLMLPSER